MAKRSKNIEVISISFVVIYTVVFFQLFFFLYNEGMLQLTLWTSYLFAALLVTFYLVNKYYEWTRKWLLVFMAILSFYFAYLYWRWPLSAHFSYIIVNMLVVFYFSQKRIEFRYKPDLSSIRKCVLVIDDDEGLQKIVQKILLSRGFSVLTAGSGEKGLQVARTQKPDLILLDVILPGLKGREVCSRLKEDQITQNIPVIFLTAKDSPDDINAEIAAGAVSHLTKPVNARVLVAEIRKILKMT